MKLLIKHSLHWWCQLTFHVVVLLFHIFGAVNNSLKFRCWRDLVKCILEVNFLTRSVIFFEIFIKLLSCVLLVSWYFYCVRQLFVMLVCISYCRMSWLFVIIFLEFLSFLRARASIAIVHINYSNSLRLSVRLSICSLRPGANSSPGEIQSSGFHHMIA